MSDFRFDYKKHRSKNIDPKMLDDLMEIVLISGTSYIASIIAGTKVIIFFVYVIARKKIIDNLLLIKKQEYEQKRVQSNTSDIGEDEFD